VGGRRRQRFWSAKTTAQPRDLAEQTVGMDVHQATIAVAGFGWEGGDGLRD
jgi:hypothetical protein